MRTFTIGDIHGAHKALVQCLERSGFDRKRDRLITIGDICDGWSDVAESVEELLTIDNRIDVIGNHDEWFRRWLKTGIHPDQWTQGGNGTCISYGNLVNKTMEERWGFDQEDERAVFKYCVNLNPADIPGPHWKFFMDQRLYYQDEERNYFFVHGGFDRIKSIEENRNDADFKFYWDRDLWKQALSCGDSVKLQTVDDFDTIFIGHTATTKWKTQEVKTESGIIIRQGFPIVTPLFAGGVWNLDTGAGWNGKLTIMDVDTKEYWQSDFVRDLYPAEAGRKF